MKQELVAVILAAGKGTRMKSVLPKVLHTVGGKPMLQHVIDAAADAGAKRALAVIGFGGDEVRQTIGSQVEYVVQAEQLGTGHALMQTRPVLEGFQGTVLLLCGDTPLLQANTLRELVEYHHARSAAATVLTAIPADSAGYGRILRGQEGRVTGIVEQ